MVRRVGQRQVGAPVVRVPVRELCARVGRLNGRVGVAEEAVARALAQEGLRRQLAAERIAVADVAIMQVHLREGVAPVRLDRHRVDPVLDGSTTARLAALLEAATLRLAIEAGPRSRKVHDIVIIVRL